MASRTQKAWKKTAEEAAELLGGHTERRRHPKLVASVDGIAIKVRLVASGQSGHMVGSLYEISLPGWPTTARLSVRRGTYLAADTSCSTILIGIPASGSRRRVLKQSGFISLESDVLRLESGSTPTVTTIKECGRAPGHLCERRTHQL
jgi:hypothetical protein